MADCFCGCGKKAPWLRVSENANGVRIAFRLTELRRTEVRLLNLREDYEQRDRWLEVQEIESGLALLREQQDASRELTVPLKDLIHDGTPLPGGFRHFRKRTLSWLSQTEATAISGSVPETKVRAAIEMAALERAKPTMP